GPAAAADPKATAIVGTDRYDTSRKVAATFFNQPGLVGIASGVNFPDALAGGAAVSPAGSVFFGSGPLLLTDPNTLSTPTLDYLVANKTSIGLPLIFGGPLAVSAARS